MSTLDALLAGGQALAINHGAVDYCINTGLLYGPGVVLTAAVVAAWRAAWWGIARCDQWKSDRANRRHYTAVATRLHQVADNTDRLIADAGDELAEQLDQQIYANDTHEGE
ncbi:hypothetical protein [Streptomyces poriferorum]|uniref:Uncharacterized protein n=1 Tax=Streptomyces poriferorum TaxID=2798799 RepID=A0ABY9J2F9_9ACTN|nr:MULTISPECIES: hypothetical protein [unclassified Streptomyces]MDP5310458.1 hypothetical protein [Streptomyces sp. Alt4]WLQ60388.1 hypothetical protein P8A19_35415 [Streptomyces sp. Alt2]